MQRQQGLHGARARADRPPAQGKDRRMSADERHDTRPEARRKLGRGLSALLGEARREEPLIAPARELSGREAALTPAHAREGLATVAVALIEPHPEQPRRQFDEQALEDL